MAALKVTPPPVDLQASRLDQELIQAPAIFAPAGHVLTGIQNAAIDLYRRGLNVFPTPRPAEVRAWAAEKPEERDPYSKPPYLTAPLHNSRMSLRGQELPLEATFEVLFEAANLAVMLGRTSNGLLCVDCDSQKVYKAIGAELRGRGLPFWNFTTYRGGGYLLRLAEGEAANMPKGKGPAPDVEIWGNRHYVILPPSIHPMGIIYQWGDIDPRADLPVGQPLPAVSVTELGFLGVILAREPGKEPDLYGLPPWTICLSQRNRKILASQHDQGTRNANLTSPIYDLAAAINDGYVSLPEVKDLLLDFCNNHCSPAYPWRHALQMLNSGLKKRGLTSAKEYGEVRGGAGLTGPKLYQDGLAFAAAYNWRECGYTAQTDRAVYTACLERARRAGSDTFRASEREIAELANISRATARKALRRLSKRTSGAATTPELLRLCESNDASGANVYTLLKPPSMPPATCPTVSTCNTVGQNAGGKNDEFRDCFYRQKVAERVYRHLLTSPEPSAERLARVLNIHSRSVGRALVWLKERGLVTKTGEGLYFAEARTPAELEALAAGRGTLGRTEARRRGHREEREKRVNMLLARERRRWLAKYHLGATGEGD